MGSPLAWILGTALVLAILAAGALGELDPRFDLRRLLP